MIVLEEAHLNEVLLPCPLADAGKAVFTENQFFFGTGYGVKCDHCGLWLDSRSRTKAEAARLWNARRRLTELAQQEDRHDVAAPVSTIAPVRCVHGVPEGLNCAICGPIRNDDPLAPASPAALGDEAAGLWDEMGARIHNDALAYHHASHVAPNNPGKFEECPERSCVERYELLKRIWMTDAAPTTSPVPTPTFRTTKEAMLYAQRHGIPAVVPAATTPPSTLAKAAEEIWKRIDSENHLTLPNRFEIQAIIERHFAPLAADSDDE